MRIGQYINVNNGDIKNKKFNYWIGISLGNKYFSKDNIQKYIEWAIQHTKDSILIVVADLIHAINLEVLSKKSTKSAIDTALRIGDVKISEIQEIISTLSLKDSHEINIVRWSDIETNINHNKRVRILSDEFNKKTDFYNRVIKIIHEYVKNKPNHLTVDDLEKLSCYILHEIPLFLDGINFSGHIYDAILYPGIGLVDILEKDLQEGLLFPELTQKLDIRAHAAIIEAFVD